MPKLLPTTLALKVNSALKTQKPPGGKLSNWQQTKHGADQGQGAAWAPKVQHRRRGGALGVQGQLLAVAVVEVGVQAQHKSAGWVRTGDKTRHGAGHLYTQKQQDEKSAVHMEGGGGREKRG